MHDVILEVSETSFFPSCQKHNFFIFIFDIERRRNTENTSTRGYREHLHCVCVQMYNPNGCRIHETRSQMTSFGTAYVKEKHQENFTIL